MSDESAIPDQATQAPALETTAGPHLAEAGFTTRRMMLDVLIGLAPVAVAAVWFYRGHAVAQMGVCLVAACLTEALFCLVRRKPMSLGDGSAIVTALILAFSLPPRLGLGLSAVGTVTAVALGKMVFGGLGHNIFNPAMVGRAFLMACFSAEMTTWAEPGTVTATTAATPLAAGGQAMLSLFTGNVSGSLGETSALAILIGGVWLLVRRSADWRLCVGMLVGVAAAGGIDQLARPNASLGALGNLLAGSAMLGAFFIVTDPVTSPLTRSGRWIFGLLVGALVVVIRVFANVPEGVMYAVLVVNGFTPLINRLTRTTPVGGHVPRPVAK